MLIYYNKNLKVDLVNDSDYLYDEVIGFIKEKEFIENPDSKEKDFNVFIRTSFVYFCCIGY